MITLEEATLRYRDAQERFNDTETKRRLSEQSRNYWNDAVSVLSNGPLGEPQGAQTHACALTRIQLIIESATPGEELVQAIAAEIRAAGR